MTKHLRSKFAIDRQAVVVIHGIGNQRPMDTLRTFVDAVLNVDPARDEIHYYSKPENFSGTFELRRLQIRSSRPRTDYFELYWQHLVPTATWQKIYAWLVLLLSRRLCDVPPAIRALWVLSWVAVSAILALLAMTIMIWIYPEAFSSLRWLNKSSTLPLGLAVVLLILQGFVLNYVGDAAIYLSPDPQNIRARQAVRDAGVALIERLHAGLDSERTYDRIVVVGHSLGSVIGYDILTYAWPRFNEIHGRVESPVHEALHAAETAAKHLWDSISKSNSDDLRQARCNWVGASRNLWNEQRTNGFSWLVTDFITLGSPLSHGMLLLARTRNEFERKKLLRELPTSPPQLEDGSSFSYSQHYKLENQVPRTTFVLNHAAVFAVTLWTNLFFPTRFGLKGDFVGGTVADVLGPGVVDVPVRTSTRRGWLAHTSYWKPHGIDRNDHNSAITRLTAALDIGCNSFKRWAICDSKDNNEINLPPEEK